MDELSINGSNAVEASVFASSLSVEAKIERARMELLDLSARNRLLNVPRFSKSAKPSTSSRNARPRFFVSS
ncbi:hypothetical protein C8J38_101868 [Rhizobium sp. PP-WC-2G-219]|nr:hypothetical protein C8J38_101868 [Rhizobium sp. PP-WC-2G-219]